MPFYSTAVATRKTKAGCSSDREELVNALLINDQITFSAANAIKNCAHNRRCRRPQCARCWTIDNEQLCRQIYWGAVHPEWKRRTTRKGKDRRWRLSCGMVVAKLPSNQSASSYLRETRIVRWMQRALRAEGGLIAHIRLPGDRLRIAVGGLTERSMRLDNPQPRGGAYKVTWLEGVRKRNLPSLGPKIVRDFVKALRPKPVHYWSPDGEIRQADITFKRLIPFGKWKQFVDLRAGKSMPRMKPLGRAAEDRRGHTTKEVQKYLSLDCLRAFSKAFTLPSWARKKIKDEALVNGNWASGDWRLIAGEVLRIATGEYGLDLPVKLFTCPMPSLKRAGAVDLDSPNLDCYPADNPDSPAYELWKLHFYDYLNNRRVGGWKRNKPVAVMTRVYGRKGIVALHNCSGMRCTDAIQLDVNRGDSSFFIQPLGPFMADLFEWMKRLNYRLSVPSALDPPCS